MLCTVLCKPANRLSLKELTLSRFLGNDAVTDKKPLKCPAAWTNRMIVDV
jgi:hypothetical protein